MQQLAVEQRRLLGDRAPWHIGDVAWVRQHEGRESEWSIRLWVEDGRDAFELDVDPEYGHVLDEILAEPLARRGFTTLETPMHFLVRPLETPPPQPELPDGFRYRTVAPDDVPERVGRA